MRVFSNLLLFPLMSLVGSLYPPRVIVKPPSKIPLALRNPTLPPLPLDEKALLL